ncbi:MAG: carboxypeptidase-like regulatory domain-containing protein, partial [Ignavibacteriaceae bacterium]|nr:carboxypeptidase-like regulatory domain-containing protein [Ignavibacteriaceae bacterium]
MKTIEKSLFIFLVMIFTSYSINSFAQIYSGQLIDKENGEPIPYANIGIIGKNIGTASNAAGWFKMELNSKYDNDTLCISSIGYESKEYLVGDFKDDMENIGQDKIELSPKIYQLA